MAEQTQILKVMVGSRAHRLHTSESDIDYRGVFVVPTADILSLGGSTKSTSWIEGKEDDTQYEIAHFLHLATKGNPSILEVFAAPVIEADEWGLRLRELFPYVTDTRRMLDAFVGYSKNQRKKMIDDKYPSTARVWKYAVAYLRTLIQLYGYLHTGTLHIEVPEVWRESLGEIRRGLWSIGKVMDVAEGMKVAVYSEYERIQDEGRETKPDLGKVNEFLLEVRRAFW